MSGQDGLDGDPPEVTDLVRAAEWRERKVDTDPADERSARAARQLRKLAAELRPLGDSKLFAEYACVCNWLSESDGLSELQMRAHDFRTMLGFGEWAETGEDYLRALMAMAQETFGMQ